MIFFTAVCQNSQNCITITFPLSPEQENIVDLKRKLEEERDTLTTVRKRLENMEKLLYLNLDEIHLLQSFLENCNPETRMLTYMSLFCNTRFENLLQHYMVLSKKNIDDSLIISTLQQEIRDLKNGEQ